MHSPETSYRRINRLEGSAGAATVKDSSCASSFRWISGRMMRSAARATGDCGTEGRMKNEANRIAARTVPRMKNTMSLRAEGGWSYLTRFRDCAGDACSYLLGKGGR